MTEIVKAIAIVNAEGDPESVYTPGATFDDEGPWALDNTKTLVHITGDITDVTAFRELTYYKDGKWISRSKAPGPYYYWKDEDWVLDSTKLWQDIREERNKRLFFSDWTQLPDCKLSITKQGEWTEYRQVLRGIPATNNGVKHLNEVVWPDEPS